MSKVIMICASPRKKSNTMAVLEECAEVLESEGLEVEIISLRKQKIESCHACMKCAKIKKCKLDDGLNDIIEKVRAADGFIVGSPVYFGTARGDLMAALQRMGMVSMASDQYLSWKVGGPIAVARRGGHTATIQELLMFYFINDMIVPGSTYWNMVFAYAPGEASSDEEGMKTVRRFALNVGHLIKKINN